MPSCNPSTGYNNLLKLTMIIPKRKLGMKTWNLLVILTLPYIYVMVHELSALAAVRDPSLLECGADFSAGTMVALGSTGAPISNTVLWVPPGQVSVPMHV